MSKKDPSYIPTSEEYKLELYKRIPYFFQRFIRNLNDNQIKQMLYLVIKDCEKIDELCIDGNLKELFKILKEYFMILGIEGIDFFEWRMSDE